jgi:hypothetical protein
MLKNFSFAILFTLWGSFAFAQYGNVLTLDNSGTQQWIYIGTILANTSVAWLTNGNNILGTEFLGTTNNQPLIFKTNNNEQMRITATGNVGIGTTAPTAMLTVGPNPQSLYNANELFQIAKTGDAYMTIQDGTGVALFGTTSGIPYVGSQNNVPFTIRVNNSEQVRIDISGNVGIGTSAPTATLDVNGTVAFSATAGLTNNGSDLTLPSNVAVVEIVDGGSPGNININPPAAGTPGQLLFIRYSGAQNLTLQLVLPDGISSQTSTAEFHAILMYIGGGWRLMSFVD